MAEFPSTEVGMAQLSSRMQQGYGAYPSIFVHADLPGLQAADCGIRIADCGMKNWEIIS